MMKKKKEERKLLKNSILKMEKKLTEIYLKSDVLLLTCVFEKI